MNHGPLIFLGVLFALATSWYGMIVTPQLQFGRQQQVVVGPANIRYPSARTGQAQQGKEVYRANGCFYCHTLHVRQSGINFDVVLANAGTNRAELIASLLKIKAGLSPDEASKWVEQAPRRISQGLSREEADATAKRLAIPDAKIDIAMMPVGPDIARGWGSRVSVAQDYLYEQPLLLGTQRIGPDLTTIGARQRNAAWHLLHLYNPQILVKGSTMPSYPFLFEKRKVGSQPSPEEALQLSGEYAVGPGYEVVPKAEARALADYLLSLEAQLPLFEGPMPAALKPPESAAATNPPSTAVSTNTDAAATNQPAPR